MENKVRLSPIKVLFQSSIDLCKKSYWRLLGTILLPILFVLLLVVVLLIVGFPLTFFINKTIIVSLSALLSAVYILALILAMGIAVLLVVSDSNQKIWDAYKKSFKMVPSYLWIVILSAFTVLGSSFLLIIPAIILVVYFTFTHYVFVLEGQKGINALLKSKAYVKGVWWQIFWRIFFLSLISIFVSITLSIVEKHGLKALGQVISILFDFIYAPFAIAYSYSLYLDVKKAKPIQESDYVGKKKWWIYVLFVIGIIIIPVILSSVVLVSLNHARELGREAALQKMNQIVSQQSSATIPVPAKK